LQRGFFHAWSAAETNGFDAPAMRGFLGHRSISSTMVYIGTTDAQAAEAAANAMMAMF